MQESPERLPANADSVVSFQSELPLPLQQAMARFGQKYDEREMKELLAEIDTDGNGAHQARNSRAIIEHRLR